MLNPGYAGDFARLLQIRRHIARPRHKISKTTPCKVEWVCFFETPFPTGRSSRARSFPRSVPAPCAFKRSSHVEKLDFADPDSVVARFDWNATGRTARFSRRRLYRRTTMQPRVPVLYGLVLPGVVGPAPRGTRDQRRGAGRGGNRTGRTRGPPACGTACRAGCPPRAARRQGGVERQGTRHQGVERQKDRCHQSSASNTEQGNSGGHGGCDSPKGCS